jgi:hypothetical protein
MSENSPSLKYSKGRNLVHNPMDNAPHTTRIIRCIGNFAANTQPDDRVGKGSCNRVIVEYGPHIAETYHRQGIPEEAMKLALESGAVVVDALCDHHGGGPYNRYAPLMPSTEKDAV